MPDRTFTYDFRANFAQFQASLAAMGKSVEAAGGKLLALDKNGQRMRAGLTQVGDTAGKIGLVAAAGVGAAVVAAANFDQAMSNVAAATHESAANMNLLRDAAIDAGARTQYSATEAAGAIEELSKAGVSTTDILAGGLNGALDLAAAGQLAVADAAEYTATTLVQFSLAGDQASHVADLLAAGAGKAQGEVSDMALALSYAGIPASQLGVSVEETAGAVALLANNGIIGERAGTGLRAVLSRLTGPSKIASKEMERLGINVFDAQGKFIGLEGAADVLQTQLGGLSEQDRAAAVVKIFGEEAQATANILIKSGAPGVAEWTGKVDDAGYAAETAAIKMDNLKGDLEQLKGAFETALIGAGDGGQGPLRGLVQGLTSAVNLFNNLPGSMQGTITGLGAITALTGGSLWFGSKVVNGITTTREALQNLGIEAGKANSILKGLGGVAVGVVAVEALGTAIRELEHKFDRALPSTQALTTALLNLSDARTAEQLTSDIGDLGDALGRLDAGGLQGLSNRFAELADSGGLTGNAIKSFSFLTGSMPGLSEQSQQLREAGQAVEAIDAALANIVTSGSAEQAQTAFQNLAASQGLSSEQQKQLMELLPQYQDALSGAANSAQLTAGATDELAASESAAAQAAQDQADAAFEAVKAMEDQRSAAIAAFDAITGYRQAMKDAAEQAKSNNDGIKGNSEAALKNRSALSSLAAAWNAQDATVTSNIRKFREARSNFIATAEAMGVSTKEAKRLANQMFELPSQQVIPVSTPGMDDAANKARTLKQILDSLKSKSITVALHYQTIGNKPKASLPGDPNSSADGGTVPTTGLPYADRHPYLLADGEEVISNRFGQADRHRGLLKAINAGRLADGGTTGGDTSKSKTKTADERSLDKRRNSAILSFELATILAADGAKGLRSELKSLERQSARLERASKKQEEAVQRETAARDAVQARYDQIASSAAGLFSSDLFTGGDTSANPWAAGGSSGMDPVAVLEADIKNGGIFETLRDQLVGRGLSGGALEASLAGGLPALQALSGRDDAYLARFQQLYGDRAGQNARIGAASADSVVGDELASANASLNRQLQLEAEANQKLKDIEHAVNAATAAVNQANEANKAAQKQNSKDTGSEVKSAAGKGKRDRVYGGGTGGRRGGR